MVIEKNIHQLIEQPENIGDIEISKLEEIIFNYPYFQTAQLLLTKGLLNTKSIRYDEELKKSAAYCAKRKKLFKIITHKSNQKNTQIKKEDNSIKEKPLEFEEHDAYSFSEWLKLSKVKKIKRNNKEEEIVNNFMTADIKIDVKKSKETFFKPTIAAKKSLIQNDDLITPTLAEVYFKQEYYEKAIEAYEKLILKYPEKSIFFANQIKLIKKELKE